MPCYIVVTVVVQYYLTGFILFMVFRLYESIKPDKFRLWLYSVLGNKMRIVPEYTHACVVNASATRLAETSFFQYLAGKDF